MWLVTKYKALLLRAGQFLRKGKIPLCCTPESNVISYDNCISTKKKRKKRFLKLKLYHRKEFTGENLSMVHKMCKISIINDV